MTNNPHHVWTWNGDGVHGSAQFRFGLNDRDLRHRPSLMVWKFLSEKPLSEGVHRLYIQEKGKNNAWSFSTVAAVTVDLTAPKKPIFLGQ